LENPVQEPPQDDASASKEEDRPAEPARSAAAVGPAQRPPPSGWRGLGPARIAALAVVGMLVLLVVYVAVLAHQTPSIEDLRAVRAARPSVLMSSDGQVLASFRRSQHEPVLLKQVSPHVIKALIATEDQRFYEHNGIDLVRSLSAFFHTLSGDTQGGSTLTQQLARNVFPEEIGRARTLNRKIKEILTALRIERIYRKDQILETYLNTVPFLYNVVGIEMAARTYFDKPSAELDVLESATLIGMLKGTHYYNPVINPERAKKRRNVVLAQMVKQDVLSQAQYEKLRDRPLGVQFSRQTEALGRAPHFAAHVRKWLIDWADRNDYNLYADGLVVHTTIDSRLQEAAARAVERQAEMLQAIADVEWGQPSARVQAYSPSAYLALRKKVQPFKYFWNTRNEAVAAFVRETPEYRKAREAGADDAKALAALKADAGFMNALRAAKTRLEAGFVAIDPASGDVKAWVGSREFERDQFDHVALAARQPGSTFKPIVYGAALEAGMGSARRYVDGPVEIGLGNGKFWRPTDMSGNSGEVFTLRDGLVYSKNTITAQVMQEVGISSVVNLAQAMGVKYSKLDPVPSLALGTSPVTLLEMVNSYTTIARLGEYRQPVWIVRITDRAGNVLEQFGSDRHRVMSQETAVELIDMLRGVVTQGTGTAVRSRFGIVADIAGKTGTTQNNTDGWFILMHPNLVAGAWVGFNDQRVAMRSDYWGQGGHSAIFIVGDFFREVLKHKKINVKAEFPHPPRPPATIAQTPPDDWVAPLESAADGPPPDEDEREVVVIPFGPARSSGNSEEAAPLNEQELGDVMRGMGRNPETGAPAVQED
jgi:penicillin-binding protein 1A